MMNSMIILTLLILITKIEMPSSNVLNDLEKSYRSLKLVDFFLPENLVMSPFGEVNFLIPIGNLPSTACIFFVTE